MAESFPYPKGLQIDGIEFPPFTTAEWISELTTKFHLRDTDIILCSYPRSGSTWLQLVLHILKTHKLLKESVFKTNPFIDIPMVDNKQELGVNSETYPSKSEIEAIPDPRILKTHLPFGITPKNPKSKYIYCLRNPKDNLLSCYYHTCGKKSFNYDGPLEQYFELWTSGRVAYGSWFEHVLGWWEHRDDPNIMILSYEELHSQFKQKVKDLSEFTGFELTDEVLEMVEKETELQTMKSNKLFEFRDSFIKDRGNNNDHHIRKGIVGEWKQVLTPGQIEIMNGLIEEKLKGSTLYDNIVYELA